jgi:hypothetical protein
VPVNIEFQAFAPSQLEVLPGDTVEWTNSSPRRHTVNATDDSFASGDLFSGDVFAHAFDAPGAYAYHCTVHLSMTGEVDVRRVLLDALAPTAVPAGQLVELSGRTADPAVPVSIERDSGKGFQPVGEAAPAADGTWRTKVRAEHTADYRAAVGADTSSVRRLLVSDRTVRVRATRAGIEVTVSPAAPGAAVLLQLDLREHFGWWPQARARLDYLSSATFARLPRGVRARVALVDRDGWTPLVTSRVVRTPRR